MWEQLGLRSHFLQRVKSDTKRLNLKNRNGFCKIFAIYLQFQAKLGLWFLSVSHTALNPGPKKEDPEKVQ